MNIFDLVTSVDIVSFWEEMTKDRPPYFGEPLFPSDKKLGLKLDWIKGSAGMPVVLKPSAFDTPAIPRARLGFDSLSAEMPFFKESMYIDEELRQQLNMVLDSGRQAYIDAIMNKIFKDNVTLLEAAAVQRERMRMSALMTGAISIVANGQNLAYDYSVPATHKAEVAKSWSDATADIIGETKAWLDVIEDDTGVRPNRAVCNRKTLGYFMANTAIQKAIYVFSGGGINVKESDIKRFIFDQIGVQIAVNAKKYKNELGTATAFVPDDTMSFFPEGALGTTWFGTTPEESDLMGGNGANVSITDTGVAVTTTKKIDPVNVDTKVSMICLPSFELADQVFIADLAKAG